jgi:hypothetical protein
MRLIIRKMNGWRTGTTGLGRETDWLRAIFVLTRAEAAVVIY